MPVKVKVDEAESFKATFPAPAVASPIAMTAVVEAKVKVPVNVPPATWS
jgi:hypothetical protein